MIKLNKSNLRQYFFIKNFISGISLSGNDILLIKKNKINLNNYKIKNINNILILKNNKNSNSNFLLLNKKEVIFVIFFLKKKYKCIPIEIVKIKSFYKIKISLVKNRDERF